MEFCDLWKSPCTIFQGRTNDDISKTQSQQNVILVARHLQKHRILNKVLCHHLLPKIIQSKTNTIGAKMFTSTKLIWI